MTIHSADCRMLINNGKRQRKVSNHYVYVIMAPKKQLLYVITSYSFLEIYMFSGRRILRKKIFKKKGVQIIFKQIHVIFGILLSLYYLKIFDDESLKMYISWCICRRNCQWEIFTTYIWRPVVLDNCLRPIFKLVVYALW